MSPLRLTEAVLVVLPALAGGCFPPRAVPLHELESLGDLVPARIITRDGVENRAVIGPGSLGPAALRITPLRYGPGSWVVRFGGWPLVYTSGRVLRNELEGDVR